jgi:hypothetical protein
MRSMTDFRLESDITSDAPTAPHHVEAGLTEGLSELKRQIKPVFDSNVIRREEIALFKLKDYLVANKLLVAMSDKNLGVVVMPLQWCIYQCNQFLDAQPEVFLEISKEEALNENYVTLASLNSICGPNAKNPYGLGKQILRFLRSSEKAVGNLLKFYGIPKIHKKPFAFHPIVPCHTVVAGPAAKLLSKMLLHIVREINSILFKTE